MTPELKKFIESLDWCRLTTHMLVGKLDEFIMDNLEGERLFIIDKLIQKFIMRKDGPVAKHPTQGNPQEEVNSNIAIKCLNEWKGKLDRSGKYIGSQQQKSVTEEHRDSLETDNNTVEQDSTFNQLIERVQEKLPADDDYKNFNSLSSYKDRIEYLETQNINLSATYSHHDLELKIDVTPHTEREKAILNNALLRQFENFSPQFSYKQMERKFGKTDPLFYDEVAKKELQLIDTKEFALDWLKPLSPAWIKPLTISGIHSAFEGYKKGKQKEFYKGYNDLIGYEIYRYAVLLKKVLSGAKITLPMVHTKQNEAQQYSTFEGLVKALEGFGLISLPSESDPAIYHEYANKISLLNYQFNEWLKETKGAEDNEEHGILNYETYLTEEVLIAFIAFIDSEKEQQKEEAVKKYEAKKAELNKMYIKYRGTEPAPVAKPPKQVEEVITKKVKSSYQSLDQAFISKEYFDKAVSALRQLQVIDDENNILLGYAYKGAMQVWYSILIEEIRGRKLKAISEAEFTVLVNRFFKGLEISEKSEGKHFRNPINKRANKKYRSKLLALM